MPVPPFTAFWEPFLKALDGGQILHVADLSAMLADHFHLDEDERSERITSGRTRVLDRTYWTGTYLSQAGLIERTSRGTFRITERGQAILRERPLRLDKARLLEFEEFRAFAVKNGTIEKKQASKTVTRSGDQSRQLTAAPDVSPEELIQRNYTELQDALAAEILLRVKQNSSSFFEHLVIGLLVAMGYGGTREDAARVIGKSGDGGIDGVIKEDRLGLDSIYVQAKRWDNPVSAPEVRGFAGSLDGHQSKKGIFITTANFTAGAREFVDRMHSDKRLVLIDGQELARLMIEHGVGVTVVETYQVHRVDSDYFAEE